MTYVKNSIVTVLFTVACAALLCFEFPAQVDRDDSAQSVIEPAGIASRVLVFSRTKGYYHESIPSGIAAIQKLGSENGFQVDTTKDASQFTIANLRKYQAIIFLSTTQDVLDGEQQNAMEQYIRSGGGFVGIHAAADTEYEWPWYNKLVGAYFKATRTIRTSERPF